MPEPVEVIEVGPEIAKMGLFSLKVRKIRSFYLPDFVGWNATVYFRNTDNVGNSEWCNSPEDAAVVGRRMMRDRFLEYWKSLPDLKAYKFIWKDGSSVIGLGKDESYAVLLLGYSVTDVMDNLSGWEELSESDIRKLE